MTSSCQGSVQRGVLSWIRCASGICSQPLAFHTCAGVPLRQLLYADDLAVMADSLEECIARLKVWI